MLINNENELSKAQTASDLGTGYKGIFGVNLQKEIRAYLDSIQDGDKSNQYFGKNEFQIGAGKSKSSVKNIDRNKLIK